MKARLEPDHIFITCETDEEKQFVEAMGGKDVDIDCFECIHGHVHITLSFDLQKEKIH